MIRRLLPALSLTIALPSLAQDAAAPGIGAVPCRAILGDENVGQLAQVGDWAMGYLAGRLDAGAVTTSGTPSLEDSVAVVTELMMRCELSPEVDVATALRAYAAEIFEPAASAPPPPLERPRARPDDLS